MQGACPQCNTVNQVRVPAPNPTAGAGTAAAAAAAAHPNSHSNSPSPVRPSRPNNINNNAYQSRPTPSNNNNNARASQATIVQPLEPGVLVPALTGQPVPPLTGKQRAVLVGINYRGTRAALRGCHNDVKATKGLLERTYGWNPQCIQVLMDDGVATPPTRANIEVALRWMVQGAMPGDVFFFHFSGHGAQQEDKLGLESDGMNETILPVDFQRSGQITDDEIVRLIVAPLPDGSKLTAIMDSCHSGTGLDLPFKWNPRLQRWDEDINPLFCRADVQLFSGCEDGHTSADARTGFKNQKQSTKF